MEVFDRPTAGTIIAEDYVIESPLAEGGMGAVYIAVQRSTNRRRAVKIMHPQLVRDPKNKERFLAEARVSAGIRSSHIVEIIGAGVDQLTGTPWLAMELLDGETLQQRLDRTGPISPRELAEMFGQLGEALGAAHDAGVVHRDLKPENLYLTRDNSARFGWSLKILDFGIAKVLQENRSSATATSQMGTPLYMSPEQAETTGQVRAATDVWAVGLIAFRSLVGRAYWLAANAENAAITALMKEMLFDPIEKASVRAEAYGARALVPEGFDGWFERCVERDATQRFVHGRVACEVLANVLREAAGTAPVQMSPPPTRDEARAQHANYTVQPSAISAALQTNSPWISAAPNNPYTPTAAPPTPAAPSSGFAKWGIIGLVLVALISAGGYGILLAKRKAQRALNDVIDQGRAYIPNMISDAGPWVNNLNTMYAATQDAGFVSNLFGIPIIDPTQNGVPVEHSPPLRPHGRGDGSGASAPRRPNAVAPQFAGRSFRAAPTQSGMCFMGNKPNAWQVSPAYDSLSASDIDARRVGCRAALAVALDALAMQEQMIQNFQTPRQQREFERSRNQLERGAGRALWCCP